jgi:NhaA family Na+:H+ antiporter
VNRPRSESTRNTLSTWLTSERPIARTIGRPMQRFLHIEESGGIVLLAATVAALIWANAPGDTYTEFWHSEISVEIAGFELHEDLVHWVNDGLMAVFFFIVGLEIKREWEVGELVDRRAAMLPAMGALGGMIVPALIFVTMNAGSESVNGWGIPMATDIAFALGIIALMGDRIPGSLKVFLLTLAIVDDIGAIVVIAVFYSEALALGWMTLALILIVITYALKRIRVWYLPVYVLLATGIWLAMFESGVHATLAGVILGIIAPTHALNPDLSRAQVEATITDPALDQTTRTVEAAPLSAAASSSVTLGIAAGLVVGKILGIGAAVLITTRMGLARLPGEASPTQLLGVCAVAGIGFTVSLFISDLAYDDQAILSEAKIGVLMASVVAAALGAVILARARPTRGVSPR